jgi:hypothetical protein
MRAEQRMAGDREREAVSKRYPRERRNVSNFPILGDCPIAMAILAEPLSRFYRVVYKRRDFRGRVAVVFIEILLWGPC